jgi:hypothetical protein
MSTYDVPQRESYAFASAAYGATTASKTLVGPPGKKGIVRDILMPAPTADLVGTTTVPEITVGASAGAVEYARFRLGTTAILGYTAAAGPRRARSLALAAQGNTGGIPPVLSDFAGHVALETLQIPADTAFVISGKAGVGGTPAGTFEFVVLIDWY